MALISLRNLTFPLMDTRSLVTIILIAAIVGVIRMAGGSAGERTVLPHGATKRPATSHVGQETASPIEFNEDFSKANPIEDLKTIGKRAGQPVETVDPIGSIMNQPTVKKQVKPNENRPGARLDDIARSMGIK